MAFVACIVEGQGDVAAVPILLKRLAQRQGAFPRINPPYRTKASSFLQFKEEFRKAVGLASAQARAKDGAVLILLDCEDDCPAELGPRILSEARRVRNDVPYLVCLARREYETWLIHAARSLAGIEGLPEDLEPLVNPESRRDAKGWFREKMGRKYIEREHQEAFTAKASLDEMMASPSFRRLTERILPYL